MKYTCQNKRILISVSNDLVSDQRVARVCQSLTMAGYKVILIGCIKKKRQPLTCSYKTFRFNLFFKKHFIFYLEYNIRLFFTLLFRRADAQLCNDTDALPANYLAALFTHRPLIFDAHELFPEVPELIGRKLVKKTWENIENFIFPHLKYNYTVCHSIAKYYQQKYGTSFEVVRNIPPVIPFHNSNEQVELIKEKKILLYQGAVNMGRGIDWIIKAMPYLNDCVLYICGDGDELEKMKLLSQKMKLTNKVIFTGRIPMEQLNQYTVKADLGFILLEHKGLSYYYSLPNRIFDYMRFKVPVVATDFPEISKIVRTYNTGRLIRRYEPQYLAKIVHETLKEWEDEEKKQRLEKVAQQFSWENESKIMLKVVSKAINS
jgi:glycosyltransferase involved in cell wall biosynthesis